MSDDYLQASREHQLRSWVTGQMLTGAGYGAVLLIGIGLFIGGIYGVSLLLPEESKQAPPPMGSLIVQVATVA